MHYIIDIACVTFQKLTHVATPMLFARRMQCVVKLDLVNISVSVVMATEVMAKYAQVGLVKVC